MLLPTPRSSRRSPPGPPQAPHWWSWWRCAQMGVGSGEPAGLVQARGLGDGLGAEGGRPPARAAGGRPRAVPARTRGAPRAPRRHTLSGRGRDTSGGGGGAGPGGRNAEPARGLKPPRMAQGRGRRAACVGP